MVHSFTASAKIWLQIEIFAGEIVGIMTTEVLEHCINFAHITYGCCVSVVAQYFRNSALFAEHVFRQCSYLQYLCHLVKD